MLSIDVHFLSGRFTASAYNDRNATEWPPHPARLVSAIVDALHDVDDLDPVEVHAVDELTSWREPWIVCSPAHARRVMTHFVPVNDEAICERATLHKRELALLDAEEALDAADDTKAQDKAANAIAKARQQLQAEGKKRALPEPKTPKNNPAGAVMPWGRTKQPRTFPTVIPEHPVVSIVFENDPSDLGALQCLLHRIGRMGHSSSAVAVHASTMDKLPDGPDRQVWHPSPSGIASTDQVIRVPFPDQREQLEQLHHREAGKPGRSLPSRPMTYGVRDGNKLDVGLTDRSLGRWIGFALRSPDGSLPPAHAAVRYAEALRDVFAERTDGSTLVTGRDPSGAPARAPHAAFLSLPFVAHRHSDGAIRGFAISLPYDVDPAEERRLLAAIAAWERATDPDALDERPHLTVPVGGEHLVIQRLADPAEAIQTLRPAHWARAFGARPTDRWATVTPIALGGSCGPFHSRHEGKRRQARRTAVKLLEKAILRAVAPPPGQTLDRDEINVTLDFDRAIPGTPTLRQMPPYQRPGHDRPRPLVHARIRLPFPIVGPLLLGSGRHLGLGLCLPLAPTRRDRHDTP